MAEARAGNQDILECPICLGLLKDPVALTCGHSYCLCCIENCWDTGDRKGVYSCPECSQTFAQRPILNKNIILAELADQKKSRIQTASSECAAGPGDVACDICPGRKLKAVKSCLECLKSYCETHLKTHDELHGKNHTVFDATGQLQEWICPRHNKVIDIFCRTDQSCICYLCMLDDHEGHDTITATTEWSHKKEGLGQSQRRFQQIIQLKEKELQELRKAVETLKSDSQTAVKESERMLTEMIHSVKRMCSEVTELIRAEVSRAEGLLKRLEQEIAELKRTDAEMKRLSLTEDPIHFLKKLVSMASDQCSDVDIRTFSQSHFFEPLKESVSTLKMQLEEKLDSIFKQEIVKISAAATKAQITTNTDPELPVRRADSNERLPPHRDATLAMRMGMKIVCVSMFVCLCACVVSLCHPISTAEPEPVTREDFLKYSCYSTLDPNTANEYLHLSEENRRVENRLEAQSYPDHPDRFDMYYQVLCREGVSARCYWEVEWSGLVHIAVSYRSISRKGWGNQCKFGYNDQSWSLDLTSVTSFFHHNNKETNLPLVASSRIGVYVDHRAGTLAFYSISDAMSLLHRVNTTFTHTLYPGFFVWVGSSVKLL